MCVSNAPVLVIGHVNNYVITMGDLNKKPTVLQSTVGVKLFKHSPKCASMRGMASLLF